MKRFRLLFALIPLIMFFPYSNAQKVSSADILFIVKSFMEVKGISMPSQPILVDSLYDGENALIYQLSPGGKGFILISADKRAFPVLGYSFEHEFSFSSLPEHTEAWLFNYLQQIRAIVKSDHTSGLFVHPAWNDPGLLSVRGNSGRAGPLILSQWHQGTFYNDSCPADPSGPNGRANAGCVPLAMAQLIYYHRSPASGTGSCSYWHNNYGLLQANFGNTVYNYDGMLIHPDRHRPELPQLIYHCGVAVNANYNATSTGASTEVIVEAIKQYFGYDDEAFYLAKSDTTDVAWKGMIKTCIDERKPVIYRGSMGWTGHAWICDGYDDDFFHFNWGWGGYANGYYFLDNITPGGYNFTTAQGAIFNLMPPSSQSSPSRVISFPSGTICNAMWPLPDSSGLSASILFQPGQEYSAFQIMPELLDLQSGDTIKVYEGSEPVGQPDYILTSQSSGGGMHFSSGTVCIITVNTSGAATWALSYLAHNGGFCPQTAYFQNLNGTIYDGSGNFLMIPGSECSWLIAPQDAVFDSVLAVKISVGSFSIMPTDSLFFFDGPSADHPLLASYAGDQVPGEIVSSSNKVFVTVRISPASMHAQGFRLNYSSLFPEYCRSVEVLTERDGIISNGSNGYNYLNNTLCQWILEVPDSEGITFAFTNLNTEPSRDRIEFYNASANPEILMRLVSGSLIPEPFTIKGTKIRVVFHTDYSLVGKGFDINYHSETVGIGEEGFSVVKLYPNPASAQLKIVFPEGTAFNNAFLRVTDISGREVKTVSFGFTEEFVTVDVRNISPGLYFIILKSKDKLMVHRFIKQ